MTYLEARAKYAASGTWIELVKAAALEWDDDAIVLSKENP